MRHRREFQHRQAFYSCRPGRSFGPLDRRSRNRLRSESGCDKKPSAQVILRFSNGEPAIVESTLGNGRVITTATPYSDPLNDRRRPAWNRGTDEWPFVVLVNEIFKYLAQGNESPLNYDVSQTGHLNQRQQDQIRYQWFRPEGVWQDAILTEDQFTISTRAPGIYRLKGGDTRGLSANLPAERTRLDRVELSYLDTLFGAGNYQIARDRESIDRKIGVARQGYEFYPFLMLFMVLLLGLEHLLSNRFYANPAIPQTATPPGLSPTTQ